MNITEFANLLETLNIPIALNRFSEPQKPPFLIYLDVGSQNFAADNIVFHEIINIDVELYTKTIDDALDSRIKQLFTDHEIFFEWTRNWIEQDKIYQTVYEVSI